jgi:hypothetical protein
MVPLLLGRDASLLLNGAKPVPTMQKAMAPL